MVWPVAVAKSAESQRNDVMWRLHQIKAGKRAEWGEKWWGVLQVAKGVFLIENTSVAW
jgi:hypothetical protein